VDLQPGWLRVETVKINGMTMECMELCDYQFKAADRRKVLILEHN
jgi:hypothetical protein